MLLSPQIHIETLKLNIRVVEDHEGGIGLLI